MKINQKTLTDLEFQSIVDRIIVYCKSELAKKKVNALSPIKNKKRLLAELRLTNELLSSFESDNAFPSLEFDQITEEIRLLSIENSFLETLAFLKIKRLSERANEVIRFVEKFSTYYPTTYILTSKILFTKEIIKKINRVFNQFGEVKDDSTADLKHIRQQITSQNKAISDQFRQTLKEYGSKDFLDPIQESVVDNKPVLAVKSAYRKQVKGVVWGRSKTGSIVFMEPQRMVKLNHRLQQLKDDERQEVVKVLKTLSDQLREHIDLLGKYQSLLAHLDFVRAKALYAHSIKAVLPQINQEKKLKLIKAYHPILYQTNKAASKQTIPQDIELTPNKRIIAISGPNAGGKSITLKTIGLLQLMLQSGLLVPVHPRSSFCFYDNIMTDIGDNQSIENQLSTYSYRLKQMSYFLKECDKQTLFLIDEFGTGSDPELGGALAEVFLEELYDSLAGGILTTHYNNIKLKIETLPEAVNACMLFDKKTWSPLYMLEVGQAGSSFTFEVARKNNIPFSLINRAKKKIDRGSVRLDKTMVKLQQKNFEVEKTKQRLQANREKAKEQQAKLELIKEKTQTKLQQFQEAYDRNQKYISIGKKIDVLAEKYFYNKQKKVLIRNIWEVIEMENAKREKTDLSTLKENKRKQQQIDKELSRKIISIKKEKKSDQKRQNALQEKIITDHIKDFSVGDRVKMEGAATSGVIQKIEKNAAIVNFGLVAMKVEIRKLKKVNHP